MVKSLFKGQNILELIEEKDRKQGSKEEKDLQEYAARFANQDSVMIEATEEAEIAFHPVQVNQGMIVAQAIRNIAVSSSGDFLATGPSAFNKCK